MMRRGSVIVAAIFVVGEGDSHAEREREREARTFDDPYFAR